MADSILGSVIELLAADDPGLRNVALNWLCEGYIDEPGVAEAVFQQWSLRSPELAFTQFPMLAYFPVAASQIAQACEIAAGMVAQQAPVTSTITRCAGKLIEQVVRLPARDLEPHLQQITAVAESHKIFFRVDLPALNRRLQLLQSTSDQLMELLESSVNTLASNPQDDPARQQAQQALEALRFLCPEQLDLGRSLQPGPVNPAEAISCELALHSLSQFPDESAIGPALGQLLHSSSESQLAMTVEALVRSGTGEAARLLVENFDEVSPQNQPWIARGLQRMRVHNLAPLIAELRAQTSDECLDRMLLIAELQQLDPQSAPRMIRTFDQLSSVTPQLLEAGLLYTFVCGPLQGPDTINQLEKSYLDLQIRVRQSQLNTASDDPQTQADRAISAPDKKTLRKNQAKHIKRIFGKGHQY